MRSLRRIGLYALCWVTLCGVRLALWAVRYQHIRRWLVRPCETSATGHRRGVVSATVRCLKRTAAFVPGASCLTQSLACQAILSWRGIPCDLQIGVRRDAATGAFNAHAWLVWDGYAVLEAQDGALDGFSVIKSLPTPALDGER